MARQIVPENRGRVRGNVFEIHIAIATAGGSEDWTSMDALCRPAFPLVTMRGLRRHRAKCRIAGAGKKPEKERAVSPIGVTATHAVSLSTRNDNATTPILMPMVLLRGPGAFRVR